MDDHGPVDNASPHEDHHAVSIKIEPDMEEAPPIEDLISEESPSSTTPTADENDPLGDDAMFEESMVHILQDFNNNSSNAVPEDTAPYDSDYEEAVTTVELKRAEIASKDSLGASTDVERVELKTLEMILNKLRKSRQKEDAHRARELEEQSMFVPGDADDDIEMSPAPSRMAAMNEEDSDPISISDDEEQEREQSPPRNAKTRGGRGSKSTARGRKSSAKTENSRIQKRGQPTEKRGREGRQGPTMTNIGSLLRNDIVADAAANQGAGEQPNIEGIRNKKDALTALLASIPKEQRDISRGEKSALDKAAKQFRWRGQGSMQVRDGGWRLKGMKTSLKNFQLLGAAWGCEREAGTQAPFGGMLADTMGYGKVNLALRDIHISTD